MNKCKKCGAEVSVGAKFCSECGEKVEIERSHLVIKERKNVTVKKPIYKKWWFWLIVGILVLGFLGRNTDDGDTGNTEESENAENGQENTTGNNESTLDGSTDLLTQFVAIGFTEAEAASLVDKFTTMGLTEVSNIDAITGNGIDGLQAFRAKVFDYDTLTLQFTIENRQLCYVSVNGFPAEKVEYYINFFGKLKYKIVNTKKEIVFYDIWDENGEIIENAVGYQAIWDRESNTIKEYTE